MALFHFSAKVLSRGTRSTVRAVAYRAGIELTDTQTGETFIYKNKDVQHVELVLPKDAPEWAIEIQKLIKEDRQTGIQALSEKAEAAEKRIDAQVWREFEFSLHRELTPEQNIALAKEFVEDQISSRGMAALLNFHFDKDEETGEEKPHCHVLVPTRRLSENGFHVKKENDWNKKALIFELREQWAAYSNFHLKLHGHDVRIDYRSYQERRIDIEPQPKRGAGVLEIEEKAKALGDKTENAFATEKAQAFHAVQLRNLYRILRRPEVIFDIISRHHATFMWGDVQKKLHQYIDDPALFERMDARLRNSNELILLKWENRKAEGEVALEQEEAIYTTRTLLKAERSLLKTAEALDKAPSHEVGELFIENAIQKGNQSLHDKGILDGLSQDQLQAIHHLVKPGQLKCIVGIAGATALGVCQESWKAQGYAVYGLAPTGKAAQNLQQSGIESTTLHKFLKSFEEGRCHYKPNSVLVVDEAGMVDVERFSALLGAVKHLGVKLIVVGDGAQLQPVEAGPGFRLITERIGKSELNTVIRQREEWQKEATRLFGKQETQQAIQAYMDKGHVHIIEEKVPSLSDALATNDQEKLRQLSIISTRVSARIYREMMRDAEKENERSGESPSASSSSSFLIKDHQDYMTYLHWKTVEKATAEYGVKKNSALSQEISVRNDTKEALLKAWHASLHDQNADKDEGKAPLMLAFSNKDVSDLTIKARHLLKQSGHIQKEEFLYKTKKEIEDDFGRNSKSGEKLSSSDYLSVDAQLMTQDDKLLTKLFARLSNELKAMGAVSKAAFQKVADHFLGIQRDKDIRAPIPTYQSVREEERAERLLNEWKNTKDFLVSPSLEREADVKEERKEHGKNRLISHKEYKYQPNVPFAPSSQEVKQVVERNLPQDLRKAIQHRDHTHGHTQKLEHTPSKKTTRGHAHHREAERAHEEYQRRLAFEQRARQIEREVARTKARDLSL